MRQQQVGTVLGKGMGIWKNEGNCSETWDLIVILSRVNPDLNHGRGCVCAATSAMGIFPPAQRRQACMHAGRQAAEPSNLSGLQQPLTAERHRRRRGRGRGRSIKSPSPDLHRRPHSTLSAEQRAVRPRLPTAYIPILCPSPVTRHPSLWLQRLRIAVPRFATFLFCSGVVETTPLRSP